MAITKQLRQVIAESGISATQLAKELQLSQPTISRFVAGNDIKFSIAERIATYFNLELRPSEPATKASRPKPARKGESKPPRK